MARQEVVLCTPVRTAVGTYNGSLKATPATEIGAIVVRETLHRSEIDPAKLSAVVMGNVVQAGNKMNPARQAAIHGGVPVHVPAMTVNRVCGSGAQAIVSAAQEIWLGFADAAIAGGMENMDAAPYLMSGGRWGYRMGDAADLRCHAARRPQRCLLRPAFRLAHGGSRHQVPDQPGGSGPLGGALAAALCRGSGRRAVRCGDRRRSRSRAAKDRRCSRKTSTIGRTRHSRASPS